jgi:hypothetical protein
VPRGTGRLVVYSGPALRAGGGVGNRRASKLRESCREPEGADGAGAPVRFVVLAAPRTGSNMLCSIC